MRRESSCWRKVYKKTMLGVCWMLVILPSCMSSHMQQSTFEPELIVYVLTAQCHQPVFVPCPNVSNDDDVTFELFKDQDMVCQVSTKSKKPCNETQLDVQPHTNEFSQVEGFNLNATPTANQTVYRCEGKIMYPPPIQTRKSTQIIKILVNEDHCSCNKGNSIKTTTVENKRSSWIWVMVVSLLSAYSLVVTIVALVIRFKLKEADYQNDYINTKPKAPRNRKKKGGLQLPIPRYI